MPSFRRWRRLSVSGWSDLARSRTRPGPFENSKMGSERSPSQAAIIVASMSPTMARPAHSHYRWTVCALLFFATTISYVDRQVLSMLAKTLQTHIGWTDMQYGQITTAFSLAYATGLLLAGWGVGWLWARRWCVL